VGKGTFITLEGIEGCGKTTQAKRIFGYLKKKKIPCILTREPGGSSLSERIRSLVLNPENKGIVRKAELLLYIASRAQHIEDIIKPSLENGKVVICDRFSDATIAYQGGGRRFEKEEVLWLNNFATGKLKPDLTILLDVPVEVGFERIENKKRIGKDRIEEENLEFHRRVRKTYLNLAKEFPDRIKVVDGNDGIEEVWRRVKKIVDEELNYKYSILDLDIRI